MSSDDPKTVTMCVKYTPAKRAWITRKAKEDGAESDSEWVRAQVEKGLME